MIILIEDPILAIPAARVMYSARLAKFRHMNFPAVLEDQTILAGRFQSFRYSFNGG